MKTKISHLYGNQEDLDLQLVKLSLDLEDTKESEALEKGWLIYDNIWYASRSSRIKIDDYKPQKQNKKLQKYSFYYQDTFNMTEEVIDVYITFINIKKFKKTYKLDTDLERSSGVFVYNNETNKLVAFTKMVKYEGGIESQFTVWDYSEPKASIGKVIIDYEIEAAKKLGHKYLYIGPIYGLNSIYKTNLSGFQWWDGENWINNDHTLFKLLESDSNIKTLEDLNNAFI